MTWGGGKPHQVGDRGQRYEISVYDEAKKERIVAGWSDDKSTADRMATTLALRPGWSIGQVRDRQATS